MRGGGWNGEVNEERPTSVTGDINTPKFPEFPREKSTLFNLASGLGQDLVQEFVLQVPREEINEDFHFKMKILLR